jgi:hypothetical protein
MWRVPHRIEKRSASGLGDVDLLLADIGDQVTLIFDVDGTVARQGSRPEAFAAAVNAAIDRFEGHPLVDRAIALTNGAERGVPRMISRGNKPWTTRRRLGITVADQLVVVGDQILTDGLLAWRLGATFVHLVIDDHDEPPAQAKLRRRGRWLEPILFTRRKGGAPT